MTFREAVAKTILKNTNLPFWKTLQHRFEWLYSEIFQSVANNPHVLHDQRSAKLLDYRFYLAEQTFAKVAKDNRLVTLPQKVKINNWNYTLVRGGDVCMVQAYVHTPSELARPSKFREAHVAINSFLSAPPLPFADVEPEMFDLSKVNGIITHGPKGKDFTEDNQTLAFLNFTVPDNSYSVVGVNIPVTEVIARFERVEVGVEVAQRDIAKPRVKRPAAKTQEKS